LLDEINSTAAVILNESSEVETNAWYRQNIDAIVRCITDPSVIVASLKDLTKNLPARAKQPQED